MPDFGKTIIITGVTELWMVLKKNQTKFPCPIKDFFKRTLTLRSQSLSLVHCFIFYNTTLTLSSVLEKRQDTNMEQQYFRI